MKSTTLITLLLLSLSAPASAGLIQSLSGNTATNADGTLLRRWIPEADCFAYPDGPCDPPADYKVSEDPIPFVIFDLLPLATNTYTFDVLIPDLAFWNPLVYVFLSVQLPVDVSDPAAVVPAVAGFSGVSASLTAGAYSVLITGFGAADSGEFTLQVSDAEPVPEPGSLLLLGAGFTALACCARKRLRSC